MGACFILLLPFVFHYLFSISMQPALILKDQPALRIIFLWWYWPLDCFTPVMPTGIDKARPLCAANILEVQLYRHYFPTTSTLLIQPRAFILKDQLLQEWYSASCTIIPAQARPLRKILPALSFALLLVQHPFLSLRYKESPKILHLLHQTIFNKGWRAFWYKLVNLCPTTE